MVRQWMESVSDAEMIVGLVTRLSCHHERGNTSCPGLPGNVDHVEHEIEMFINGVGNASRHIRQGQSIQVLGFQLLNPSFYFADRVQEVINPYFVLSAELALQ